MLKTFFTPFATQKQSSSTMIVTPHDINFMMGFIKEEEMFSSATNATNEPITTSNSIQHVRFTM